MSILKALQKKQIERRQEESARETEKPTNSTNVVSFEKNGRRAANNTPPDLFAGQEIKIGKPPTSSKALAFNGQPDSLIGKALPDLGLGETARATLSVLGAAAATAASARAASEKHSPDFTIWNVEAERVEPRLIAITQPHSNYCEEYRSLRTQILHKSQRQKLQSIVVASVNAGEGKSITALNLSWLLAQTDGVKALLIDSDLRMPSLTDYLGIETDKGLSDVLAERASLQESIIKLQPSGLHLLPGGEARSDVAELISGPKFKEILRQAREMFDYIIIDVPPLAIFTDATVLINHADGAMLVVRAGKTKYNHVDRVLESLPRERMLGVVLNHSEDVTAAAADESHYKYGYYGSNRSLKS